MAFTKLDQEKIDNCIKRADLAVRIIMAPDDRKSPIQLAIQCLVRAQGN